MGPLTQQHPKWCSPSFIDCVAHLALLSLKLQPPPPREAEARLKLSLLHSFTFQTFPSQREDEFELRDHNIWFCQCFKIALNISSCLLPPLLIAAYSEDVTPECEGISAEENPRLS